MVSVSIIFGLVLCLCRGYIIKNCYMPFFKPRVISGSYVAEQVSVVRLLFWFFDEIGSGVLFGRFKVRLAGEFSNEVKVQLY